MGSHHVIHLDETAIARLNRTREAQGREYRIVTADQLPPAHVDMDTDPVARVRQMRRRGEDILEIAVEAGIEAREKGDLSRFIIGDLAREVQKKYGENTLGLFAKRINLAHKTALEYRRVCEYWDDENSARAEFLEGGLTYTHLREAMRLKKKYSRAEIEAIVRQWMTGNEGTPITTDEAIIQVNKLVGKPVPPVKLFDAVGKVIEIIGAESSRPRVILELEPGTDYGQLTSIASMYGRLVVTEPEEEKAVSDEPNKVAPPF